MAVLIACEESQVVANAFRKIGVEAYSNDMRKCSGGHSEYHLETCVTTLLSKPWEMIIAFPPCTHLASSGARWFAEKQLDGRQDEAIEFFLLFSRVKCDMICIENPIGIMSTRFRKPDQIIQPWQFGHGETKATCLWLRGLPLLKPTNIVEGRNPRVFKMSPSKDRAKMRSKTYEGIADAMAEQWGPLLRDS